MCRINGVGAPLRNWLFRLAMTIVIGAIAVAILSAPAALWIRIPFRALAVPAGIDQAFRRMPAFDPLGRIRWRLPASDGVKRCALTFDDGPSPATAGVLDVLAAEGVP